MRAAGPGGPEGEGRPRESERGKGAGAPLAYTDPGSISERAPWPGCRGWSYPRPAGLLVQSGSSPSARGRAVRNWDFQAPGANAEILLA